jgi:hypothetical protein
VLAWQAQVLAVHASDGCANGPIEAVNLLIRKVKHVGHGFGNVANDRLRSPAGSPNRRAVGRFLTLVTQHHNGKDGPERANLGT